MVHLLVQAAGGALIGASAALLALGMGQIAGISSIWGESLRLHPGQFQWRLAFLAGLLLPAVLWGAQQPAVMLASNPVLIVAGLLVGIGTSWGSGCTSGHGVCGNANASPRSMLATVIFMRFAMLTVFLQDHGVLG